MRPAFAPYTRREVVLLGVVLAAGVAARMWALSHSAVEHFDEGVYASNVYFGAPAYAYPLQRFYAPPLLPALIEAVMIAGLPPNLAALMPSFLAGSCTIAALWWFGRSWFGPEVGLAAAALAALSDFHIAFSATALTDVLLGLWLVLAVDAIGRSLLGRAASGERPGVSRPMAPRRSATQRHREADASRSPPGDYRWAIAAGVYTGLAWWTKYNGWLPLAIEAAALPLLWLWLRPPRELWQSWLACFAVTVLVAAAVWSPYLWMLQSQGGYGPIAANHSKYIVGLTGWWDAAVRQLSYQSAFGQWLTASGVVAAFAWPALVHRRGWSNVWRYYYVVAAILGLYLLGVLVVAAGAVVGLARTTLAIRRGPKGDADWHRRAIGLCLVAAWFGGMLLATPLYTPYPRLALPLLLAAWLATALNLGEYLREAERQLFASRSALYWSATLLAVTVLVLMIIGHFLYRVDLPSDRRGLLDIAQQVRLTATGQPRATNVYGEPALFFQLRAAGEEIVGAVQDVPTTAATIEGKAIPTLLIVGPHAQRDPDFLRQFAAVQDRWELVREFDYRPSAVVWLDLNDPRRSPQETASNDRARLYELRP